MEFAIPQGKMAKLTKYQRYTLVLRIASAKLRLRSEDLNGFTAATTTDEMRTECERGIARDIATLRTHGYSEHGAKL